MRWSSPLEPAVFIRRCSRFHGQVQTSSGTRWVHIPNSGRLRELLVPGNRVWILPHENCTGRRTQGTLILARTPNGRWACVHAQLPPRLLLEYLRKQPIPTWGEVQGWRWEPRVPIVSGHHRLDLALHTNRGIWWIETKSITLVRNRIGLFPDAVTHRGREHVETLIEMKRVGYRVALVFVVQRADVQGATVDAQTDPALARAVRRAIAHRVPIFAFRCRVSQRGIVIIASVPFLPPE